MSLEDRLEEIVNREAFEDWLNLSSEETTRGINPFDNLSREDIDNPHLHLLSLMRRSEYFGFTCKHLLGITLPPFQIAVLHELWNRPFPMLIASRGAGKSWLLALYFMLRATFCQGAKIVVVGAAFRQSKIVFEYCETIWRNAPILRDLAGNRGSNGPRRDIDRCYLTIGESVITAIPLGTGEKIRGQRANIIGAEEFGSLPIDIFENVVSGFAAVSMSPIEKTIAVSKRRVLERRGLAQDKPRGIPGLTTNQTILSGTCTWGFTPFADYWRRYKSIVESEGDETKLNDIFAGDIPEKFDYRDYSVIRIPVTMLPEGFMDQKHIAKARATIHRANFLCEYGAIFVSDSSGFFKRSLIESCVVGKTDKPILHSSCSEVRFTATLRGNPKRSHALAIDPASELDNFSIVVLECWPDHRRIVHCWTTTRNRHKAKVNKGLVEEKDFYSYTARKIRELMKLYPCERIAIDSQGGGVAVMEALQDPKRIPDGEQAILPIIDYENPKLTDDVSGNHILEVVVFSRSDWVSEANHGMRKDFEDKVLLFPEFDPAVVGLAIEEDKLNNRVKIDAEGTEKLYDTLEDCVMEIEDLKDELATIVHTQIGTSMRDRWDTPETKIQGGKKGRARKDRYSALLMANMIGRQLSRVVTAPEYECLGGFASQIVKEKEKRKAKAAHVNPAWYKETYGMMVRKER